jgi:hypothetical protein
MRITIELDEKGGSAAVGAANTGGSVHPLLSVAATSSMAASSPPAEVLEQAAAGGAINAGPAPAQGAATSAAPDPFHLPGGAMTEAANTTALSGGPAPNI